MPVSPVVVHHSCLLCSLQELESSIVAAFPAAQERSRQLGRAVILRLDLDARSAPFWGLLPHALRQGQRYAVWHDPETDFAFVGLGELFAMEAREGDPLPQVQAFWRDVAERVLEPCLTAGSVRRFAGGLEVLPLVVGGLAFGRHSPERGDAWEGWPTARFWVPELMLLGRPEQPDEPNRLIYHMRVKSGDSLKVSLKKLCVRLENLQSSAFHEQRPSSRPSMALRSRPVEARAAFCRRVQAARQAMCEGRLAKVVLARAALLIPPEGHVYDLPTSLACLRAAQPDALCFALAGPGPVRDGRCFLGASPEILVRVLGRRFRTVALAGTARRDADPQIDAMLGRALLASSKDLHEQALVVEAIENAVLPLCTVLNTVKNPTLRKLPGAQHLQTPISGMLRAGAGVFELLQALHPTPAVGGSPALAAAAWLREHESLERGWYAAPVGWLDAAGNGAFAVAIRSALVTPQRAWAFAGAGIVEASDPSAEWEETELKLQTVAASLATRLEAAA